MRKSSLPIAVLLFAAGGAVPACAQSGPPVILTNQSAMSSASNGMAIDVAGNLYVSISASVLEYPAGCYDGSCAKILPFSGMLGASGVTVSDAGDVFASDFFTNKIVELPAGCSSSACQVTVASGLGNPAGGLAYFGGGLAYPGDLYYADTEHNKVVKASKSCPNPAFNPPFTCTSTIGYNLNLPYGVAIDANQNVYITDQVPNSNPIATNLRIVPWGCTGTPCQITIGLGAIQAGHLTVDGAGNVYVSINKPAEILELPAGCNNSGCLLRIPISGVSAPTGIALDAARNLYIGDTLQVVIRNLNSLNVGAVNVGSSGTFTLNYAIGSSQTFQSTPNVLTQGQPNQDFTLVSNTCSGTLAANASCAVTIKFAPRGPGTRNGAVQLLDSGQHVVSTTYVSGQGMGPAVSFPGAIGTSFISGLNQPTGGTMDGAGNLYVADSNNHRIVKIPAGCTSNSCMTTAVSGLTGPATPVVDPVGNLFFSDPASGQVMEIPVGCTSISCQIVLGYFAATADGLAIDAWGNLFLIAQSQACQGNCVIRIPPGCGDWLCTVPVADNLATPLALAVDGDENLWLADNNRNSVTKYPPLGTPVSFNINRPTALAVDPAGNVLVGAAGVIEIPKGCADASCFNSSGVSANPNLLLVMSGVTVDPAGNIYLIDKLDGLVFSIPRAQPPSLTFADTQIGQTSSDSPQHFLLHNFGNQALTAVAPGLSASSTSFVPQTGTGACSASFSLAPGTSCPVNVAFVPQALGSISGTVNITDNALNATSTQSAGLQGKGLGAPVSITLSTNTDGQTYTVDGVPYNTQQTFQWYQGSVHTVYVLASVPVSAGTEYRFRNWSDGTTSASYTINVGSATPMQLVANFDLCYLLTVNTTSGGTVSPGTGYYVANSEVALTATPNAGYAFGGFTGSFAAFDPGVGYVILDQPKTVSASFGPGVQVTLATNPAGLAVATDLNSGVGPLTLNWVIGSAHTIVTGSQATSDGNTQYIFTGWSDGGAATHTVTAGSVPATYTATFSLSYYLNLNWAAFNGFVNSNWLQSNGYYAAGTVVSLSAVPNPGFVFTGWTGAVANPNNPNTTVTMNGPVSVYANFVPVVQVTVGTDPALGIGFGVDGTAYFNTTAQLSWTVGSTHTISTAATLTFAQTTQFNFLKWSDGGAVSHTVTATAGTTSYTASFSTSYQLATAVSPPGGGTVTPATGAFYASGTVVNLNATAAPGYVFSGWSGPVANPGSASTSVTMSAPQSVTANFVQVVQVTVGASPAGIPFTVDGTAYTSAQSLSWNAGSTHNIATGSPAPSGGTQYTFSSWSDAGAISHQVTASAGTTSYTASFSTAYLLTTAASPGAGGTVSPASETYYVSGTVVPLTATPNPGYSFSGWTGNVAKANNAGTTVTMSAPQTVAANFVQLVQVTVGTSPAGLSFSIDGTPYTSAQSVSWVAGSSHTIATTATQTPSAGTQYTFANWGDGGAASHQVTASAATTGYTATFNTSYQLTTASSPGAGGTASPASGSYYAAGAVVNLTAASNPGYSFSGWNGSVANPNIASTTVTMTAPQTVSATFVPTVQVTVGTSPAGLQFSLDGTTYSTAQTITWIAGSSHSIATTPVQTPATGVQNTFTGWSDGGALSHSVTAAAGVTGYTASFSTAYQLTTAVNLAGGGAVSPAAAAYYPPGTVVPLTATANSGYAFLGWTGAVANANNASTTITMNAPQSATANFAPTVQVTVGTSPAALSFNIDGAAFATAQTLTWIVGSSHTIAATSVQTPSAGTQYTFSGWSDGGQVSHAVTAPATVATYTANFGTSYQLTTSVKPAGAGTVSPVTGAYYAAGSVVSLAATPGAGYVFSNWSGAVANANSASTTVTMTGPQTVAANFTPTVQVTVGTTPAGLSYTVDGVAYTSAQTLTWVVGSQHSLGSTSPQTPAAGTKETFTAWSDGGALSHTVMASAGVTGFTASFGTSYLLTTASSPSAGGTVSPATGAYYPAGTTVNLSVTPAAGYIFANWTGTVASASSASTTVTMSAPESVTASFVSALSVSPTSAGFGTVYLGAASTQKVTVTNRGVTPITFSNAQIKMTSAGSASQFALNNPCPNSLAGGASCTVTITFTGGAYYNAQTATLSFSDNAPDTPQVVAMTAVVINPQAFLSSTKLSFSTSMNSAETQNVTLTNTGATPLAISGIAVTGPDAATFTSSSNCGNSVAAGASCTINLTFNPPAKTKYSAVLSVTDNAQSGTQTVALSGNGH